MKRILIISALGLFLVSCGSTLTTAQTQIQYPPITLIDTIPPTKKGYIIVEVVDFQCMNMLQPVKSRKECTFYYYKKEDE